MANISKNEQKEESGPNRRRKEFWIRKEDSVLKEERCAEKRRRGAENLENVQEEERMKS